VTGCRRWSASAPGAAATAALTGPLKGKLTGKRVGLIVCGSNIDIDSFAQHVKLGEAA
jgi:threonine dehydratase